MFDLLLRTLMAVTAFSLSGAALADVVTKCGQSEGWAYYVEGGLVQKKDSGWVKDQTSKGSYLLLKDGSKYDIVFSDATERTKSAREEGAQIAVLSETDGIYTVIVNYAGATVEVWTFTLDRTGAGTLFYHQTRYGPDIPIRKHSTYRAICKK